MLAANPEVGRNDAAMANQARTLIALRASDPTWRLLGAGDMGMRQGAAVEP